MSAGGGPQPPPGSVEVVAAPLSYLLLSPGEVVLRAMLRRLDPLRFSLWQVAAYFTLYFLGAAGLVGSAFASGLVIPQLVMGALFGRLCGVVAHYAIPADMDPTSSVIAMFDPGALALLGSAAMFGGVSRRTVSLAVIMVELSGDLHFLLPMMLAIIVAKRVGDLITAQLYHHLLAQRRVPFLDSEPSERVLAAMRECCAGDVMSHRVVRLPVIASYRALNAAYHTTHRGFPVVNAQGHLVGLLHYWTLSSLLACPHIFRTSPSAAAAGGVRLSFEELVEVDEMRNFQVSKFRAFTAAHPPPPTQQAELTLYLSLAPYVDTSVYFVRAPTALDLTYRIFRSQFLRHLVVVDVGHRPVGIITRKNLLEWRVERRATSARRHSLVMPHDAHARWTGMAAAPQPTTTASSGSTTPMYPPGESFPSEGPPGRASPARSSPLHRPPAPHDDESRSSSSDPDDP